MAKTRQCAEKVTISATVNDIFNDLQNQMNDFPVHRYIKRKQQDHLKAH